MQQIGLAELKRAPALWAARKLKDEREAKILKAHNVKAHI